MFDQDYVIFIRRNGQCKIYIVKNVNITCFLFEDECFTLYQEISDAMLNGNIWKKSGNSRMEVESVK